jgi:hypothetical protein
LLLSQYRFARFASCTVWLMTTLHAFV